MSELRARGFGLPLAATAAVLMAPAVCQAGTVSLGTAPGTSGVNEIRFVGSGETNQVVIDVEQTSQADHVTIFDSAAPITIDPEAADVCTNDGPNAVRCRDEGGSSLSYWFAALGGGDDRLEINSEFARGRAEGGDGDDRVLGAQGTTYFPGDDLLDGGPGNDTLSGRAGADVLVGGPGTDTFDGGSGDDRIEAADGVAEKAACGPGNADHVSADAADELTDCEQPDQDGDGAVAPRDCNDANPAVKPGATDVPGNGVDEDCDGVDKPKPDRDRDGAPDDIDCNDHDPAIRPGAVDVPGNRIDEDCTGGPATTPRAPVEYVRIPARGGFRLPAGVPRKRACRGRVFVSLLKGKDRLAMKITRVNRRCRWSTAIRVRRDRIGAARRLVVSWHFGGNRYLAAARFRKTVRVPAR